MDRRQFLRGAGGLTVLLPTLASLLPKTAEAAWRGPTRFACFASQHGGIWGEAMYPGDGWLTEQRDVGHLIRRGPLQHVVEDGRTRVSEILSAPSTLLTEDLLGRMSVLRGLDIPFYMSHHTGGYLGNFARNDTEFETTALPYRPTIDQIMAWSDRYLAGHSVMQRSVQLGGGMSWGWANPSAPGGEVQEMPSSEHAVALFERLLLAGNQSQDRRLVVDKVLDHYRNLRQGAHGAALRLSPSDRVRLDAHMERLFELERKLGNLVDCGEPTPPSRDVNNQDPGFGSWSRDPEAMAAYYDVWTDVMAAAFACGSTTVLTVNSNEIWHTVSGDWHQDTAHLAAFNLEAQMRMRESHQRFFERVFLDFARKLSMDDGSGNLLDNSLLMWVQESGPVTHDCYSMPVVTIGDAGGRLQAGHYIDYRNRDNDAVVAAWADIDVFLDQRSGLLYGQYLANILDAVGVDRLEWSDPSYKGYGLHNNGIPEAWPSYVEALAEQPLPWFGEPA